MSGSTRRLGLSSNLVASFAARLGSQVPTEAFLARVGVSESEFGNEKLVTPE